MDMDGVLVHEERLIPGADRFIKALQGAGIPFLVLTNNSIYTPRDLAARLTRTGIELVPEALWTSALATAQFLDSQRPEGTAFVVGEAGLTTALHAAGYAVHVPHYLAQTDYPAAAEVLLAEVGPHDVVARRVGDGEPAVAGLLLAADHARSEAGGALDLGEAGVVARPGEPPGASGPTSHSRVGRSRWSSRG